MSGPVAQAAAFAAVAADILCPPVGQRLGRMSCAPLSVTQTQGDRKQATLGFPRVALTGKCFKVDCAAISGKIEPGALIGRMLKGQGNGMSWEKTRSPCKSVVGNTGPLPIDTDLGKLLSFSESIAESIRRGNTVPRIPRTGSSYSQVPPTPEGERSV